MIRQLDDTTFDATTTYKIAHSRFLKFAHLSVMFLSFWLPFLHLLIK